jgi:hypothetical protein
METSHGIILRCASVYLFEVTRFNWGREKNGKKSTSLKYKIQCGFFSIFFLSTIPNSVTSKDENHNEVEV